MPALDGEPPYDLRGRDLSGMKFAGADLTAAKLQNTTLLGTSFVGVTSMARADLTGATIGSGTDFSGCDLTATQFGPSPKFGSDAARRTRFVGATIPYRTLGDTWGPVDLTRATLVDWPDDARALTVGRTVLTGVSFARRNLEGARFWGATLRDTDFSQAVLSAEDAGRAAEFAPAGDGTPCDLTGATFAGARLDRVTFTGCTLSRADFTRATLEHTHFGTSRLDGARFDHTDMTKTAFAFNHVYSTDPANRTSFRGATVNIIATIFTTWTCLDLTGVTIADLRLAIDSGALRTLKAQNAILTGMDLSGADLTKADLTGADLTAVDLRGARLDGAVMRGVKGTAELFRVDDHTGDPDYTAFFSALKRNSAAKVAAVFGAHGHPLSTDHCTVETNRPDLWWTVADSGTAYSVAAGTANGVKSLVVLDVSRVTRFDGASLAGTDLSPNGADRTVLRGATFTDATLDRADLTRADLGRINPYRAETASRFLGARMHHVGLARATLDGAKLGSAALHGANLIGASLKEADLTGARLGMLSELFRLVKAETGSYAALLTALKAGAVDDAARVFAACGHPIPPGRAVTITGVVPERNWTIGDGSASGTYTVLRWTASDGTTFLVASGPAVSADLSGAYLPDAVLTDANLSGVTAARVQLYGNGVRLDGAILDHADFSHANLANSSIGVTALYGVNLSAANLIGATIIGADLTRGVNLSHANLQGTDFTGSRLDGAKLQSAAVSIGLTAGVAGTYLFTVPASPDVLSELKAAAEPRTVATGDPDVDDCAALLAGGDVAKVRTLFSDRGINLSGSARIQQTADPDAWRIPDPGSAAEYRVWRGFDEDDEEAVLAAPSAPRLEKAFRDSGAAGSLRLQFTVSGLGLATNQWRLDNDSDNPTNLQLGYATLFVTRTGEGLLFYGTTLRIVRMVDGNRTQIVPCAFEPTALGSGSCLGPATICPNGQTLEINKKQGVAWEKMLRMLEPATPPTCVPSSHGWCPEVSAEVLAALSAARRA